MNISQFAVFPIRWQLGMFKFDGTIYRETNHSMSHWFPTYAPHVYLTNPNAYLIYGKTSCITTVLRLVPPVLRNSTICDAYTPSLPSKPFTYLLF